MPDTRLDIEPERIDDLPLALGMLQHMGVPQVVDSHLGAGHGNRQGLSYGQLTHGFAGHIITAQDHRLLSVEPWSQEHQKVLTHLLGAAVGDKDFTDDRLADLLYALGRASPEVREAIETDLGQHLVRAYHLPSEVGRADTTTVSVYHEHAEGAEGLLQFGKSKDRRPDLRQYVQALGRWTQRASPWLARRWTATSETHRCIGRCGDAWSRSSGTPIGCLWATASCIVRRISRRFIGRAAGC